MSNILQDADDSNKSYFRYIPVYADRPQWHDTGNEGDHVKESVENAQFRGEQPATGDDRAAMKEIKKQHLEVLA